MQDDSTQVVSALDLERLLATVNSSALNPAEGIFGPGSVSWKVNRESALFLAAGRAALLQLAHPWVATAIAEHSRTLHDPIGRFHHTFRVMFTMAFAPVGSALAAARHLHRRHASIRGTLPESAGRFAQASRYEANDLAALRWVYATLVDSSLIAYELVLPKLSASEVEQYYAESKKTAALFGIPSDCLPKDWQAFRYYFAAMLQSDELGVGPSARQMAHQLQAGAGLKVRPPFWYGALTTNLLPPRLREEFQFAYGEPERRSAEKALRWLRRIYPRLPAMLRFVGPYNEVQAKRNGRARPSLPVRLSNRLWIGQPCFLAMDDPAS
ncbi:MAG: oxygenase MpaB family protein [Candidatus Korobacteraceae bacterium]